MSSIWVGTSGITEKSIFTEIVMPLLNSLRENGVPANLKPIRSEFINDEGVFSYALFPAGTIHFTFKAIPNSSGELDVQYVMASVHELPKGTGVTEETILSSFEELRRELFTRRHSISSTRIIESDSFAPERTAKSSGCYIATSVYGGYDAPQVRTLRRFRDRFLQQRPLGRLAVLVYYKLSPSLARSLGSRPLLSKLARIPLDRVAKGLNRLGFSDGPYKDASSIRTQASESGENSSKKFLSDTSRCAEMVAHVRRRARHCAAESATRVEADPVRRLQR